jgi:ABC-type polysaccharide transport system permease subunit
MNEILARAAGMLRAAAQQWLGATVWRTVWSIPLPIVLVIAVILFILLAIIG